MLLLKWSWSDLVERMFTVHFRLYIYICIYIQLKPLSFTEMLSILFPGVTEVHLVSFLSRRSTMFLIAILTTWHCHLSVSCCIYPCFVTCSQFHVSVQFAINTSSTLAICSPAILMNLYELHKLSTMYIVQHGLHQCCFTVCTSYLKDICQTLVRLLPIKTFIRCLISPWTDCLWPSLRR